MKVIFDELIRLLLDFDKRNYQIPLDLRNHDGFQEVNLRMQVLLNQKILERLERFTTSLFLILMETQRSCEKFSQCPAVQDIKTCHMQSSVSH